MPADLTTVLSEDPALAEFIEVSDEGHWLWREDQLDRQGYGYLYREGYMWRAHRWVWFLVHGFTEQPLDHLCRTRNCVNPGHLEAVTTAENNRRIPRPDVCSKGHPLDGKRGDGSRRCLTCHREAERERRKRRSTTSER